MAGNRPTSRPRNISGAGKSVGRRGSGLGTGPVGSAGGYHGRSSGNRPSGKRPSKRPPINMGRNTSGNSSRGTGGLGGGLRKLIVMAIVVLLLGGGGLGSLFGGGGLDDLFNSDTSTSQNGGFSSIYGNFGGGSISSGWDNGSNSGKLNTSVDGRAREKYTQLKGNGQDKMTIMLYLCGTDLESRSKMATSDLVEMINADVSDDVNLIVYSGGCRKWQNDAMSNQKNQIWQVQDKGLVCLEQNAGNKSMTDEDTLSYFIRWCAKKFPANRNALIMWDHGGGSVSGFGYDEKFASSGSMNLAEIDQALTDGGVKFDFVGYDACLMATAENALMLTKHADYLIASEETEPGIGWYYTNWLTAVSENPSMPTLEIGKQIIDDFVDTCARKCHGQSTTLSIIDLAEFEKTVPQTLADFSAGTSQKIKNKEYATVSNARSDAREFGVSSKIDQVDLVHLAKNMKTEEGDALAKTLLNAVKYNRTSSNMTNSYGVSIYFPYRKVTMVDQAVETYEEIGMDEEYMRCIQEFASMEVSGQAVSGGTTSPVQTLSGGMPFDSSEMLGQLLESFLGGNVSNISGLNIGNIDFLGARSLNQDEVEEYLSENRFDASNLMWKQNGSRQMIELPEEEWELVQQLYANMFIDDGEGYIDMGLDTVYEFDKKGNLLAPEEFTWIAVNRQPVAYYHENTVDDGEHYSITGRIPVLYNGERGELVVEFTDQNPYGTVTGVRKIYTDNETQTVAKTMNAVKDGDVIDFICDYYSYEGDYLDSYMLGEQLIVDGELEISDVYVEEKVSYTYLFTDIYNQKYWTEAVY